MCAKACGRRTRSIHAGWGAQHSEYVPWREKLELIMSGLSSFQEGWSLFKGMFCPCDKNPQTISLRQMGRPKHILFVLTDKSVGKHGEKNLPFAPVKAVVMLTVDIYFFKRIITSWGSYTVGSWFPQVPPWWIQPTTDLKYFFKAINN